MVIARFLLSLVLLVLVAGCSTSYQGGGGSADGAAAMSSGRTMVGAGPGGSAFGNAEGMTGY